MPGCGPSMLRGADGRSGMGSPQSEDSPRSRSVRKGADDKPRGRSRGVGTSLGARPARSSDRGLGAPSLSSPHDRAHEPTARRGKRPSGAMPLVLALLCALYGATPAPAESTSVAADPGRVGVFYATNRKRETPGSGASASEGVVYGGERGDPSFGRCEVAFTPIPLMQRVAEVVPFYVPSETSEMRIGERPLDDFWADLTAAAKETGTGSVVVYVHGYGKGFERTCEMAADLQRSLAGEATVLMFSWPSNAEPVGYLPDQVDIEWSVPFLADLLQRLGEHIGPINIQLMPHSLGTRGALLALWRLGADVSARPVIGRLILLAPDFDSQTFLAMLPRLVPLTTGIVLYASNKDAPLRVSRQINGYPRLGEGGELLTLAEGLETIDVSQSGRYQIMGHEYFYYNPLVKADLIELLTTGRSAAARTGLGASSRDGRTYWEIRPRTKD